MQTTVIYLPLIKIHLLTVIAFVCLFFPQILNALELVSIFLNVNKSHTLVCATVLSWSVTLLIHMEDMFNRRSNIL